MSGKCPSLIEALAQVEDPRKARGKRHPLAAILALSVAATLCGAQGYGAIAEWGRDHGAELARALGFTRAKTPCAGTLHYLFTRLDRQALERVLSVWAEAVLATFPPPKRSREALAIDGKTLRGMHGEEIPGVHLVAAYAHQTRVVLAEAETVGKGHELAGVQAVLAALPARLLAGRVVTGDALLATRALCRRIIQKGGTISSS